MEALPGGSLTGRLRMTEQGETIAQKYAHLGSAVYNLEILMASAAAATSRSKPAAGGDDAALQPVLDQLALWSRDAYRALLQEPGFMTFYRSATPIDALENARIGSRPSRRTGQATLEDLRAIPWVFSWTQARFYLPGWFGAGSALERLRQENAAGFALLMAHLPRNPFLRYVLTNIESSLVSANEPWMREYAALVPDAVVRERFLDIIVRGLNPRVKCWRTSSREPSRRGVHVWPSRLPYARVQCASWAQIELLRTWRAEVSAGRAENAEALIPDVLVSVNALASGLRTTG